MGMTRFPRSRRLAFAGAVVVLVLTACGTDESLTAPSSSTAPAPAVIEIVGGAGGAGPASAEMADAAADSTTMTTAYLEYVYSGDIPDLTGPAASWFFAAGAAPSTEQIAALAVALGVEGDVRGLGADFGGGWTVGPADYSGPSVTVSADAMQSWWFSPGSSQGSVETMACEYYPPGDPAGGGTDATAPVCAEPEPPANVPTAEEAKAMTLALFESLGVAVDAYDFEAYADEWSANVTGYLTLDGVRTTVAISAGYGAEGALTWANGFLATPERGADYPRIGVEAAVQRLNDQQTGMWATARGTNMAGYAEAVPSIGAPVGDSIGAVEAAPPGSIGLATSGGVAGSTGSAGSEGGTTVDVPVTCDPAADCVEPLPADMPAMPIDAPPAEPLVVTLTGAVASLEQVWAADQTVWLLPGYAFDSADQGRYSVIAVEDQYLAFTDPAPVPMPEPMPPVSMPSASIPGADGGVIEPSVVSPDDPSQPVSSDDVDLKLATSTLVGLSEADAAEAATANGWTMRVVRIDGEDLVVTADFSPSRVNVAIESGTVTAVISAG